MGRPVNDKCRDCAKNIKSRDIKPDCYVKEICGHRRSYYRYHDRNKRTQQDNHRYIKYKDDKCALCGETKSVLEVHHIKPQAIGGEDARFNTLTLCVSCHKTITKYYKIAGIRLSEHQEESDEEYRKFVDSLPPL
ncbi:MAG: HNH endonuclease [Deltaproteobacteria bacterium]